MGSNAERVLGLRDFNGRGRKRLMGLKEFIEENGLRKKCGRRNVARVFELIDTEVPNLFKSFQNSILKACDKKIIRKNGGDTWWCNKEVQNFIVGKKEIFQTPYATRDQKRIGLDTMPFAIKQKASDKTNENRS